MTRPLALLLIFAFTYSCQRDGHPAAYEVLLTDSITNFSSHRYPLITEEIDGVIHFVGYDSTRQLPSTLRLADHSHVNVSVPATDVLLGSDSVRIGIVRVLGPASTFAGADPPGALSQPDYLLLMPPGTRTTKLYADQTNIGPISQRTVFRVGRHHYLLKSVDTTFTQLVIEPIDPGHNIPLTAELDIRYRRVNVTDLDGRSASIAHEPGKRLALCFTNVHDWAYSGIATLDSLGAAAREQGLWKIACVNHSHSPASIRERVAETGVTLPFYKSTPTTCLNLNCRPNLPYCVEVNAAGNVVSYYRTLPEMNAIIARSLGLPVPAASSSTRMRPLRYILPSAPRTVSPPADSISRRTPGR